MIYFQHFKSCASSLYTIFSHAKSWLFFGFRSRKVELAKIRKKRSTLTLEIYSNAFINWIWIYQDITQNNIDLISPNTAAKMAKNLELVLRILNLILTYLCMLKGHIDVIVSIIHHHQAPKWENTTKYHCTFLFIINPTPSPIKILIWKQSYLQSPDTIHQTVICNPKR